MCNKFTLTICASVLLFSQPVMAKELFIAVSPYQVQESADAEKRSVLTFLANSTEIGDQAHVIDGYNARLIATFNVDREGLNPRAKLRRNQAFMQAYKGFVDQAAPGTGADQPVVKQVLRIPHTLRFIADNFPETQEREIIFLGSVQFDSPSEKSVSMANNHIPSDQYLLEGLETSPYSMKGYADKLKNSRIHIAPPEGSFVNTAHEARTKRFYGLMAQLTGAVLTSFTPDRNLVFDRAMKPSGQVPESIAPDDSGKLEMQPVKTSDAGRPAIFSRGLSAERPTAAEMASAQNLEIGIRWDCAACDIDLYSAPQFGVLPLYFGNTKTEYGQFFKDFVQSPDIVNGLESIEYTQPIDLSKLFIGVNFYSGTAAAGKVTGAIRLSFNNRTYEAPFIINAATGNKAANGQQTITSGKPANSQWIVIDPMAVFGVR